VLAQCRRPDEEPFDIDKWGGSDQRFPICLNGSKREEATRAQVPMAEILRKEPILTNRTQSARVNEEASVLQRTGVLAETGRQYRLRCQQVCLRSPCAGSPALSFLYSMYSSACTQISDSPGCDCLRPSPYITISSTPRPTWRWCGKRSSAMFCTLSSRGRSPGQFIFAKGDPPQVGNRGKPVSSYFPGIRHARSDRFSRR
jgi:hypothetical protein